VEVDWIWCSIDPSPIPTGAEEDPSDLSELFFATTGRNALIAKRKRTQLPKQQKQSYFYLQ
jgi:hypothetical protein